MVSAATYVLEDGRQAKRTSLIELYEQNRRIAHWNLASSAIFGECHKDVTCVQALASAVRKTLCHTRGDGFSTRSGLKWLAK